MEPRRPDPLEIAWAAGFFDGEGSTIARRDRARPGYRRLVISAPQSGGEAPPDVLLRFRGAMLGMGSIGTRNDDGIYCWRTNGYPQGRAVLALLWRHLGAVKRRQAAGALAAIRHQYASGRVHKRASRSRSTVPPVGDRIVGGMHDDATERRAWAAGFLDAEGCFGLARKGIRRDGVASYRIPCSASQHGELGVPPAVLVRLHAAMGGLGKIERHGDPDDHKWVVEGEIGVKAVLAVVEPWLGPVKRSQAGSALTAFAEQRARREPMRGSGEHCKRGHPYDDRATRNGRTQAICNACRRIMERRKRAAQKIPPRRFKNTDRRYTD
jgi:hypothetical protein